MPAAQVNGDIKLTSDGKTFVAHSGPELARDQLTVSFGLGEGAWDLDQSKGFPYLRLFDLRGDEIQFGQTLFVQWLRSFDFVTTVESVTVEYDSSKRTYSISFVVKTDLGRVSDTFNFGLAQ